MNKITKSFGLLILILVSQVAFGQKQEKIYYDKEWQVTQSPAKAEYYRLITFDTNGKPLGIVKDYYITGELQWEGKMLFVDKPITATHLSLSFWK